jgi:hypothetical protein
MNLALSDKELMNCKEDEFYFIRKYLKLKRFDTGIVPFEMYPHQMITLHNYKKHQYVYVIKSRQMGLTALNIAFALEDALFRNKRTIFISPKLDMAKYAAQVLHLMIEYLKPHLRLAPTINALSVDFGGNGSIKFVSAITEKSCSEHADNIIFDEFTFTQNTHDLYLSWISTLDIDGKVIISTSVSPNMPDFALKLWNDKNKFLKIKLPWYMSTHITEIPKFAIAQDCTYEYTCEMPSVTPKDVVMSMKVSESLRDFISDKCIAESITVSDYIRNLIKDDLFGDDN